MKRVEAILKDPVYRQYVDRTEEKERDRIFCRHHLQHLLDVARITYILILEEGSLPEFIAAHGLERAEQAKEVIYGAALLHDIGRWQEYETGEDHALVGSRLAADILERTGFDPGEGKIIIQAIREHRWSAGTRSFLGDKLHRADALSRICLQCQAREQCHKLDRMETAKIYLVC